VLVAIIEWVEMLVRWLHVIAGIAWIGSSFYFVFLDSSLRRRPDLAEGVGGESWQVHGGGFYHMQKYMVAPAAMPAELHWFKWEAYFTWLSGFALLILIYYIGADLYLIDRAALDISAGTAIGLSVVSLAAGWLIYDRLCKSPLGRNDGALSIVGFVLLVAAGWAYTHAFGGRGAYVHMGALIGTMMVANVFFVIIPNQKKTVAAMIAGDTLDPELGRSAKQRSVHNNYLTLPVLFVMISGHYPVTFGHEWNWLILAGIMVVGGVIRHFFNLRNQGQGDKWWLWGIAALLMIAIIWFTSRQPERLVDADDVDFTQVRQIITTRCTVCHSVSPTFEGIDKAPKDVVIDTIEDIRREIPRIRAQAVVTDAMPPGNASEMTEAERNVLADWIAAGAPTEE